MISSLYLLCTVLLALAEGEMQNTWCASPSSSIIHLRESSPADCHLSTRRAFSNRNYLLRSNKIIPSSNSFKTTKATLVRGGSTTTTSLLAKKLASFQQRALGATLMLGGLAVWIKVLGTSNGVVLLVWILQFVLYSEATFVATAPPPSQTYHGVKKPVKRPWNGSKWWWFAVYTVAANGRHVLELFAWQSWLPTLHLVTLGMAVLGLISLVLRLNEVGNGAVTFRRALSDLATHHLALSLLVIPSSFWIATLHEYGVQWILFPALLVIINDTLAYVCGVLFGRHALLPVISPNKTWQGFVGAWLATWAFAIWWFDRFYPSIHNHDTTTTTSRWILSFVWAALASWITPFGGFLASIVKRAYGHKDFAQWIPGHGGVVDRLDCHLVMAPLAYTVLQYLAQTNRR